MPLISTIRSELDRILFRDEPSQKKSIELVVGLLDHATEPFDRSTFHPGHLTASALVLHPTEDAVLMIFHNKLARWLPPGGHVDQEDPGAENSAAREAQEETGVLLTQSSGAPIVRVDVHGIPARRDEPYHLHHDLTFAFLAAEPHLERDASEVAAAEWTPFPLAYERLPEFHLEPARLAVIRSALRG